MPAPHPPEFRRRAINLARQPGASIARVAKDLGISESGLRRWMSIDDVDAGRKEGLSSDEPAELVPLRRAGRVIGPPVPIGASSFGEAIEWPGRVRAPLQSLDIRRVQRSHR